MDEDDEEGEALEVIIRDDHAGRWLWWIFDGEGDWILHDIANTEAAAKAAVLERFDSGTVAAVLRRRVLAAVEW